MSILSNSEEDRKTDPGELGILDGAKDVPLCIDWIEFLCDECIMSVGGTETEVCDSNVAVEDGGVARHSLILAVRGVDVPDDGRK